MGRKKKNNNIKIEDWAGNILFEGLCDDPKVLKVMKRNKVPNDDIYVSWQDETRDDNVYESIDW